MEKLPLEINKGAFIYRQNIRKGKYAIYEQILKRVDCPMPGEPKKNVLIAYEVIRIKRQKAQEIFGKSYPAKEIYPKSSDWELYGWTFKDRRSALSKFKDLTRASDSGQNRKNTGDVLARTG